MVLPRLAGPAFLLSPAPCPKDNRQAKEAEMRKRAIAIALLAMLMLPVGGAQASPAQDVVVSWNAIMTTTISAQNPFAQARIAAITQLAVFEAVNAITGKFDSYLGSVTAAPGASVDAAAVTAAHDVLANYIPSAVTTLDAAEAASLGAIPDGQSKDDGVAVGASAAAALIAARTGDGSSPPQFYQPTSSQAGMWQTTPSCPAAGGTLLHWQNVTPFGVRSNAQFRSAPPPDLSSPRYTRDYNEVMAVGASDSAVRPGDRADVARLFAAVSAPGAWNAAARQLAEASPMSLTDEARVFALMNMAMSDGLTSSLETKYHYTFWRPETAIRAGDNDGNDATTGDNDFAPFITTPCFPGYPSAHASASYAARSILERTWGNGGHSIELTHSSLPGKVFSYTNLIQITDDVDDARVYGGIHFRFDQEAGATQGRKIGQYIYAHELLTAE